MKVGYKRQLELNDIWTINPDRSADVMSTKLKASFNKRVARGDEHPLLWALHETFKTEFYIGGVCQFLSNMLQVLSPYTLRYLITFANTAYDAQRSGRPVPNIGKGIGLVIGITFMQMCQS